jgi:hypothetical protein
MKRGSPLNSAKIVSVRWRNVEGKIKLYPKVAGSA